MRLTPAGAGHVAEVYVIGPFLACCDVPLVVVGEAAELAVVVVVVFSVLPQPVSASSSGRVPARPCSHPPQLLRDRHHVSSRSHERANRGGRPRDQHQFPLAGDFTSRRNRPRRVTLPGWGLGLAGSRSLARAGAPWSRHSAPAFSQRFGRTSRTLPAEQLAQRSAATEALGSLVDLLQKRVAR